MHLRPRTYRRSKLELELKLEVEPGLGLKLEFEIELEPELVTAIFVRVTSILFALF